MVEPTPFLSAALRSWMVQHLLDEADLEEIYFLLLELGHEADESFQADPRRYLKRQMSLWAAENSVLAQDHLRHLCEGIVQFYLVRHPQERSLEALQERLPAGWHFEAQCGQFVQLVGRKAPERPLEPLSNALSEPLEPEPVVRAETGMSEERQRREQFLKIRQRRLSLLKEWEKSHGKY